MNETPIEILISILIFTALLIITVLAILLFGDRWSRTRGFRLRMMAQWKPALVIAALFVISMGLSGKGFLNPYGITVFCQALLGLALARGIPDFEPLPVSNAVIQRDKAWVKLVLMVLIAALMVIPAQLIGTIGLDIGQQIFGETNLTSQATGEFPANKWAAFFMLLAGAGIAEETPYRLLFLSFFWRLTGRRNLSILISALLFGAYHLSPLNSMYHFFLQFPISQFLASTLIGLVWGYLYVKRGYETVVLGHALSDWLPFLIFSGT
jgi:membrane protease YdiL (CAAX protease family)